MKKDFCFLVGRFQPFHKGHLASVKAAAKLYKKVGIGIFHPSFGRPNKKKIFMPHAFQAGQNPFPLALVEKMIRASLREAGIKNFAIFKFYPTGVYSVEKFKSHLPFSLDAADFFISGKDIDTKIISRIKEIGGTYKTHKIFREENFMSGTEIRKDFFSGGQKWEKAVPSATRKILQKFDKWKTLSILTSH